MINRMREEFMARQQGGVGKEGGQTLEGYANLARDFAGRQGGSRTPDELLEAARGVFASGAGGGGQGQTLPGGTPTLQPPPNVPPGTTAITGNEVPYQVNPNRSSGLQGL